MSLKVNFLKSLNITSRLINVLSTLTYDNIYSFIPKEKTQKHCKHILWAIIFNINIRQLLLLVFKNNVHLCINIYSLNPRIQINL